MDNISDYLECPVLWQISSSVLVGEESIFLGRRLNFEKNSKENMKRLAIAHGIYHQCQSDHMCVLDGVPAPPRTVQARAAGIARACLHFAS